MSELQKAAQLALDTLKDAQQHNYALKHSEADYVIALLDAALNKQYVHAEGCWSWGPSHYLCCYNEVARLRRLQK